MRKSRDKQRKNLGIWVRQTYYTVVPPLSAGNMFQDPQWMSEAADSTELYIYYVFSYAYIPLLDKGMIYVPGNSELDRVRFHHTIQNGMPFKT